jgi:hypothetical protein
LIHAGAAEVVDDQNVMDIASRSGHFQMVKWIKHYQSSHGLSTSSSLEVHHHHQQGWQTSYHHRPPTRKSRMPLVDALSIPPHELVYKLQHKRAERVVPLLHNNYMTITRVASDKEEEEEEEEVPMLRNERIESVACHQPCSWFDPAARCSQGALQTASFILNDSRRPVALSTPSLSLVLRATSPWSLFDDVQKRNITPPARSSSRSNSRVLALPSYKLWPKHYKNFIVFILILSQKISLLKLHGREQLMCIFISHVLPYVLQR